MFGDSNDAQQPAPQPDATLQHNDQNDQMGGAPPAAPANDSAGEYMLEDGTPATSAPAVTTDSVVPTSPNTDDLLDVKRQALQQLTPLIGHLDQTPEEKFRTTMMMIQATDDDSLIRQAYDAAQGIADEKAKAQALLDVVNEINYFTQARNAE